MRTIFWRRLCIRVDRGTYMMAMAMVLIRASHGDRVAERRGRWSWYDGGDDGYDDGDYDGTLRNNVFFRFRR